MRAFCKNFPANGIFVLLMTGLALIIIPGCGRNYYKNLYHLISEKVDVKIRDSKMLVSAEYVLYNPADKDDYDVFEYNFPCIEGMGDVRGVHIWYFPGYKKGRKVIYGWSDMYVLFPLTMPAGKKSLLRVECEQDLKGKMGSYVLLSAHSKDPMFEKLALSIQLPEGAALKKSTYPLYEIDGGRFPSYYMVSENKKLPADFIFTWE